MIQCAQQNNWKVGQSQKVFNNIHWAITQAHHESATKLNLNRGPELGKSWSPILQELRDKIAFWSLLERKKQGKHVNQTNWIDLPNAC